MSAKQIKDDRKRIRKAPSTERQRRFTTTDNVDVSYHAADQWYDRVLDNGDVPFGDADADDPVDVDDAWRSSIPIPYGTIFSARYARYHPPSDTILIAHRETLVTVLYADGEHPVTVAQARAKADKHRANARLRGLDTGAGGQ